MRHVALDDAARSLVLGPRTLIVNRVTVVDRVEEAAFTARALPLEMTEVRGGRRCMHHRGERRRVRRNHQVVAKASLEAKARNAERLVLVGVMAVDDVER